MSRGTPESEEVGGFERMRPLRPPSFATKSAPLIREGCYRRVPVPDRAVRDLNQVIEAAGRFAGGFAERPEVLALPRARVAIYPLGSEIIHALYLFHSFSASEGRSQSNLGVCYYIRDGSGDKKSLGGARLFLLERKVLLGSASLSPRSSDFLLEQKTAQRIVRGIIKLLGKEEEIKVKLQTRQDTDGSRIWGNVPGACSVFSSLLNFARCSSL